METKCYRVAGINLTHAASTIRTSNSVHYITMDSDLTFKAWGKRKPSFVGNDTYWVFKDTGNGVKPLGDFIFEYDTDRSIKLPEPEKRIWDAAEARQAFYDWQKLNK